MEGLTAFSVGIAIAVLLVVLTGRLLFPPSVTNKSNPKPSHSSEHGQRSRDFTFRVDEITAGTSRPILERNLKSVESHATFDLRDALGSLVIRSLARRDSHFDCATVTVTTSLPEAVFLAFLQKALKAAGFSYRCDCGFLGITPLHDAGTRANACDVIAVSGLASHALGTWKAPGENDVWLRDWLPDDVPNIRVLLYGYNTALLKSESTSSIGDLGRSFLESVTAFRRSTNAQDRPVLFIGHSLGGLLVKEALVQAYRSPETKPTHKPLYKNCCGILFFGVPHLGLRNEGLRTVVEGQPNQALIDSIVVDNESEPSHYLARMSDDFSRCFRNETRVVSFYERIRTAVVEMHGGKLNRTGPKVLMVTRKSATSTGLTEVSKEDNIPLEEDHSGLVKFRSRGQDAYNVVSGRIRGFVSEALASSGDDTRTKGRQRATLMISSLGQSGSTINGPIAMSGAGQFSVGNNSNVIYS